MTNFSTLRPWARPLTLVVAVLLAGCYTSRQASMQEIAPGDQVTVELDDQAYERALTEIRLPDDFEYGNLTSVDPDEQEVLGEVAARDAGSVDVRIDAEATGLTRSRFSSQEIEGLEKQQLSWWRTGLVAAGGVLAAYGAYEAVDALGGNPAAPNGGGDGASPTPNGGTIFSFPVNW